MLYICFNTDTNFVVKRLFLLLFESLETSGGQIQCQPEPCYSGFKYGELEMLTPKDV